MQDWQLRTPVALLIFNRPDTTERVFVEIARVKPRKLLVKADGARIDNERDAEHCGQACAIVTKIDWDCGVLYNFSDVNLGCKKSV